MKFDHLDWTFRLFVMAVLCLSLKANDKMENCDPVISVRRHSNHSVLVGHRLKIDCPISFCGSSPPNVTWFKLATKEHKPLKKDKRTQMEWDIPHISASKYILIIENVQGLDSGRYQCRSGNAIGHDITVHVIDAIYANATEPNQTRENSTDSNSPDNKRLPLYLYTAAGIVGFVIVVIVVSYLSMRGCNSKTKSRAQNENQYADIAMVEQHGHHSSNQALPRASPCGTPSHRTSGKSKSPSAAAQRDNVYGEREGQRSRAEEQGSSVVYAALNHQHLAGASPRSRTLVDERSEYSAIRVS